MLTQNRPKTIQEQVDEGFNINTARAQNNVQETPQAINVPPQLPFGDFAKTTGSVRPEDFYQTEGVKYSPGKLSIAESVQTPGTAARPETQTEAESMAEARSIAEQDGQREYDGTINRLYRQATYVRPPIMGDFMDELRANFDRDIANFHWTHGGRASAESQAQAARQNKMSDENINRIYGSLREQRRAIPAVAPVMNPAIPGQNASFSYAPTTYGAYATQSATTPLKIQGASTTVQGNESNQFNNLSPQQQAALNQLRRS